MDPFSNILFEKDAPATPPIREEAQGSKGTTMTRRRRKSPPPPLKIAPPSAPMPTQTEPSPALAADGDDELTASPFMRGGSVRRSPPLQSKGIPTVSRKVQEIDTGNTTVLEGRNQRETVQ